MIRVEMRTAYGSWVLYKRVADRVEARALRAELRETMPDRATRVREEVA